MINHGTRSGYYAHRRVQEKPCEDCRLAINEYVRLYREQKSPLRDRRRDSIRRKAMTILRNNHREEYDRIVQELDANTPKMV